MIHKWSDNGTAHKMSVNQDAGTMTLVSPARDPPTFMDRFNAGALGLDTKWFTTGSWNWRHNGEGTNPTGTLIFQEDGKVNVNGSAD